MKTVTLAADRGTTGRGFSPRLSAASGPPEPPLLPAGSREGSLPWAESASSELALVPAPPVPPPPAGDAHGGNSLNMPPAKAGRRASGAGDGGRTVLPAGPRRSTEEVIASARQILAAKQRAKHNRGSVTPAAAVLVCRCGLPFGAHRDASLLAWHGETECGVGTVRA